MVSVPASLASLLAIWSRSSLFLATVLPSLTPRVTVDSDFQAASFPTLQGAWRGAQGWALPPPHPSPTPCYRSRPATRATGQPVTGESRYYLSLFLRSFQLELLLGGLVSPGF